MSTIPNTPSTRRVAAVLVDVVLDEGQYGPRVTWWFSFEDARGTQKMRTWTSRSLAPGSRAWSMARALGATDGPFAAEELVRLCGRACTLDLEPSSSGFWLVSAVHPSDAGGRLP